MELECHEWNLTLWRPLLTYGYSYKAHVPDRVKQSFVIFDIWALWRSALSVRMPGCQNYKWRLNPVWHTMLCSCSHMATVGVKGLSCIMKRGTALAASPPFRPGNPVLCSFLLQYFDTVGWVFWPVKTVSHITYTDGAAGDVKHYSIQSIEWGQVPLSDPLNEVLRKPT